VNTSNSIERGPVRMFATYARRDGDALGSGSQSQRTTSTPMARCG
jgi:hypothetical protein